MVLVGSESKGELDQNLATADACHDSRGRESHRQGVGMENVLFWVTAVWASSSNGTTSGVPSADLNGQVSTDGEKCSCKYFTGVEQIQKQTWCRQSKTLYPIRITSERSDVTSMVILKHIFPISLQCHSIHFISGELQKPNSQIKIFSSNKTWILSPMLSYIWRNRLPQRYYRHLTFH